MTNGDLEIGRAYEERVRNPPHLERELKAGLTTFQESRFNEIARDYFDAGLQAGYQIAEEGTSRNREIRALQIEFLERLVFYFSR